jgi:periplasmic protein TonB
MKKLPILLSLWLGLAGSLAQADARPPAFGHESIEMAFDRYKGKFYALYSRALRDNPALKGKVALRFTVSPQGVFSNCRVVSSELHSPDLERKFCETVEQLHVNPFGGEAQVIDKNIEFFPAA